MSSPSSMTTERAIFALICCIGIIAIATGVLLEFGRMRRGDSIIPPRQFRMRVISAIIWAITLGSLSYAVLFVWPERGDLVQARRFISVISGTMLLVIIGLALLAYDFWMVGQARRLQQAKLERNVDAIARAEIERVGQQRDAEAAHNSSNSPGSSVDGAGS